MRNTSSMKKIGLISILLLLLLLPPIASATEYNISDCAVLNETGATYYLNQSISDSSETYCMNIQSKMV